MIGLYCLKSKSHPLKFANRQFIKKIIMKQYLTLALASLATATSLEIPGFQRSLDDIINQLRSRSITPKHNFK